MAEFVGAGDREQIECSVVKAAESKRQEAGADLYTLAEKESPKSDMTGDTK